MIYSKKFFGVVLLLIGLIAGCLVILLKAHPNGQAAAMVIVSVSAAVLGRVSGTLAARFARLCGAVFAKKPVLRFVGKISGRDLQPAATLVTSAGCVEIGYERFGYEQVKSQLIREGHPVTELRLESAEFGRYLEQARYDLYHPTYYQTSPNCTVLLTPRYSHVQFSATRA